ncbi:hypothetical protein E2C01_031551 [Portunus trituberculatus]|uniref:Uncharacterized protein n=1 Tax=Portunus trituberculatus TaxID=210409 RepID=A0A5B7ET28_PORTR|nr:hypothetical protein [Portunus trituberculatus]
MCYSRLHWVEGGDEDWEEDEGCYCSPRTELRDSREVITSEDESGREGRRVGLSEAYHSTGGKSGT